MATGSRTMAGLAGAALALGFASAPAQAAVTTVSGFSTWSALVSSPVDQPALGPTPTSPFTVAGQTGVASPSTLTLATTANGAAVSGFTGAWLGASGKGLDGNSITITLSPTSTFTYGFGFFVEGPAINYQVREFDVNNLIIGSATVLPLTGAGNLDGFLGFAGLPAVVHSVRISDGTGGPAFVIGDFFSGSAPVPEPASMALLGVGLLGLGIARRRKLI